MMNSTQTPEHPDNRIREVLIVGGGTAGWMTAAALSQVLGENYCRIRLLESDAIGTVGVGEATIPEIRLFNALLDIDEADFVSKTQGTFKLGIEFVNWGRLGEAYIHPFGVYGTSIDSIPFHHYWLRLNGHGAAPDISHFSLAAQAAPQGKFMPPTNLPNSPLSQIAYAYHFDATLYAKYLRDFAEKRGVQRIEGEMVDTTLCSDDGFIESITLQGNETLEADLFIDCTGFRGMLIEGALNTGYENWNHLLPCDRAVTVQSKTISDPHPYTRATAHSGGWQWRIPLQHRVGNGHVYCSDHVSDDEATATLLNTLDSEALGEPRLLRFNTGRRRQFWSKNCVAIGLSSGFMEPLESTSIHLIQSAISKLIGLFPSRAFEQLEIDKYNAQLRCEMSDIRDFLVLHYKSNQRDDSRFWQDCRDMDVPDSLNAKIEMFKANGRLYRENQELFGETSWLAVMLGQNIRPRGYHPLVDIADFEQTKQLVAEVKAVIDRAVEAMPSQADYIAKYCRADRPRSL